LYLKIPIACKLCRLHEHTISKLYINLYVTHLHATSEEAHQTLKQDSSLSGLDPKCGHTKHKARVLPHLTIKTWYDMGSWVFSGVYNVNVCFCAYEFQTLRLFTEYHTPTNALIVYHILV